MVLEEIAEDLVEEKRALAEIITSAPTDTRLLRQAFQAQALLEKLGISTTDVNNRITEINSGRRASVQSTSPAKLA